MERLSLTISGMSCGHCVGAVDQALAGLPGVQIEKIEIGSAVIAYDPDAVTHGQIEEAVAGEGYTVRSLARTP